MKDKPLLDVGDAQWDIVQGILHQHIPEREVWAFGSRAKWTAKPFSDLDLAVIGQEPMPLDVAAALADDLSESDLPWKVDVVDWATTSEGFRQIIERDKVVVQQPSKKRGGRGKSSEWPRTTFDQLCDIKRGASPRPIHDWLAPSGIPWVKISDATASTSPFISKTAEFIRPDGAKKSVEVFPGDFILSNSATPGIPKLMQIHACVHDGWMLLRNFRGLDQWYCYYLLQTERDNLIRQGNGSVFTNLKTEILKKHEVAVPPLEYQKKVAEFLRSLDDRITLLRETNATLEAIAQALFKSWFVDFDPVRAKMEGRAPEGMDEATAALFPDSFEETEFGVVPRGWRVASLHDCCKKIESGGTPKRTVPEFWNGAISWLTSGEVRNPIVFDTKEKITDSGVTGSSAKLWPAGTTVVAMYGATAGEVCLIASPMTANQACCGLIPQENFRAFLFFCARHEREDLASKSSGSAQQNLNKGLVEQHQVIRPTNGVVTAFEMTIGTMLDRWIESELHAQTLSTLRDTLLPRLISGQLRLPEAQAQLEVALV